MPSAPDPRQPNRTRQPASRPAQPGQRPAQPTQRAAQSAARPLQPSRSAQPVQRRQQPSARSVQFRLLTRLAAHYSSAQPAGGSRFKQQAPTQRTQGRHPIAFASRSRFARRCSGGPLELQHACSSRCPKKSSPVPMIVGVVVAVIALATIAFFVVPAVKGFFTGEDTKVTAGRAGYGDHSQGASAIRSLRFSPRTISSKIPRITTRR